MQILLAACSGPNPCQPGGSPEQAVTIAPGMVSATLCAGSNENWYSFSLAAPRVITLDLFAAGSSYQMAATLYDAQKNLLAGLYASEDNGVPLSAYLPPGTYYLGLSAVSFGGDDAELAYSLHFDVAEPSVTGVFEASAGTVTYGYSNGTDTLTANLLALSARQPDNTPLPYDVLVYLEVPGYGSLPFYYSARFGPVVYAITDFAGGVASLEGPTQALKRLAGQAGLRTLAPFREQRGAKVSPAAALGGTFRFSFPEATISRTVELNRGLEPATNLSATLALGRASVAVSFDPVPGAVEYTVVSKTLLGSSGLTVSDATAVTVVYDVPFSVGEIVDVTVLAANFTGFAGPITGLFSLPIPDRQVDLSATGVEPLPAPDGLEPNDTPETATPILLDFSSFPEDLTLTPGDVDWFTFTLTDAATVDAFPSVYFHPVLGLFDAALNELAISHDPEGWYAHLRVSLEPGTYYLAVSGSPDLEFGGEHEEAGFYDLSVTAAPPEP